MKKVYAVFENDRVLKVIFPVFLVVYLFFDAILIYLSPWQVNNNDKYKELFSSFLANGYYDSVSNGTSILYNVALAFMYRFTQSVDGAFFTVNLLSDFALLVSGTVFCYKIGGKNKYFYVILSCYLLKVLTIKSYFRASNDSFLGVFISILLYFLIYKIYDSRKKYTTFAIAGLLLSICLAIRVTAFLLFPLVVIAFLYWIKNSEIDRIIRIKLLAVFAFTAVVFTVAFHFPSLATHQKLSYESKEPDMTVNWMQRNYMGLKKIENGQEPMHRDAIWNKTPFEDVRDYVHANGEESLPNSFTKVIARDPVLLFKMTVYNIVSSLGEFLRFWVFLLLLPLISWFRGRLFTRENLPMVLFAVYLVALSTVCFSFIEFRWFIGYEVLIPVSILLILNNLRYFPDFSKANIIIAASLGILMLINLKTILSKIALLHS